MAGIIVMRTVLTALWVMSMLAFAPGIAAERDQEERLPEVEAALASLEVADRSKFFGAHEAGFLAFKKIGDSWLLAKRLEAQSARGSVTRLALIGSLSSARKTEDGAAYRSMISEVDFDCKSGKLVVIHQELKQETFGTGETVSSMKRRANSAKTDFTKPKSLALSELLYEAGCPNLAKSIQKRN